MNFDPITYQARCRDWLVEAIGAKTFESRRERRMRFLEEALELHQAAGGTVDEVGALLARVEAGDPGVPAQETGGVMVTLALLCENLGVDFGVEAERELARVVDKADEVAAKHRAKPADVRGEE